MSIFVCSRCNVAAKDTCACGEKAPVVGTGTSALSIQQGGSHYKDFKVQPIEFISANHLDFFQGNIIKYICRFRNKNGKQDLEKIKHYIDLLIELEYKNE